MSTIRVCRVYDVGAMPHGQVFLVERLWPRGVRKEGLALDGWLKDAAPSTELRTWFGHDPAKWPEFRRRYEAELDDHPDSWQPLVAAALSGDVTLLFSARDRERNSAIVLRDHLRAHLMAAGHTVATPE